jgi:hypothetical protein
MFSLQATCFLRSEREERKYKTMVCTTSAQDQARGQPQVTALQSCTSPNTFAFESYLLSSCSLWRCLCRLPRTGPGCWRAPGTQTSATPYRGCCGRTAGQGATSLPYVSRSSTTWTMQRPSSHRGSASARKTRQTSARRYRWLPSLCRAATGQY